MLGSLERHVKWFTDPSRHPTDYSLLLTFPVIAAFAVAALAIGAAAFIQRTVREPRVFRALERFAWLGPLVLGVHLGIALIAAAALGMLFVPSLRVERDAFGLALLVAEGVCGVLLLVGFATRPAAVALALLGVVAMEPFNFESILEQVHILGAAIFLFITGRGAISIDRVFRQQKALPVTEAPAIALTLLRVCMGVGIAFGALTEKLLDPGLAGALLTERPYLNFVAGLGVSNGRSSPRRSRSLAGSSCSAIFRTTGSCSRCSSRRARIRGRCASSCGRVGRHEAVGMTTARQRNVRTQLRRLTALALAVLVAMSVASVSTACGGPSDGPKPSGGVPSY